MPDFSTLEFFSRALAAGLVVGGACSLLGVLVVLKRVVFAGAALAEIASAGLALGFYLGFGTHGHAPIIFAFAVTLATAALFAYPTRNRVLPQESLIAVGFVVGAAMALFLVSKSAEGVEELKHILSGHLLTARPEEVLVNFVILFLLVVIYFVCFKQILYVSFDPETAHSAGLSPRFWNLIFYQILGLVIAIAIRSAGTLLVIGYLVLPAAGALLASRRILTAHLLSLILAAVGTVAGIGASFAWDVPASAAVVLVLFLLAGGCAAAAALRSD